MISALGLIALLGAGPAAVAGEMAPEYVSSQPEDGEQLHQAPEAVTVTFSEPLDGGSKLKVEDHCGRRVDDGDVQISLNEMRVGIAKEPSGHYTVSYTAVGLAGATGTSDGRFTFMVHAGRACSASDASGHGGAGHGNHGGDGHTGTHENRVDHGNHGTGFDGAGHDAARHGSGHSGMAAGSGAQTEHDTANMHGGGHRSAEHPLRESKERRLHAIATGEAHFPAIAPDSMAVLIALLLCAAFGALGGWLLRFSAQR